MNEISKLRCHQCVLLDWGDTVMRVFPEYTGPMEEWPRVEVVPGIVDAVRQIRRHALVSLATNAADSNERAIRAALARVGLDELFDHIFCFDVVGHRKPTTAHTQTVLQKLGLTPESTFMVGDDFDVDVCGAIGLGIRSVWLNPLTDEDRFGTLHRTIHSLDTVIEALVDLGFLRS